MSNSWVLGTKPCHHFGKSMRTKKKWQTEFRRSFFFFVSFSANNHGLFFNSVFRWDMERNMSFASVPPLLVSQRERLRRNCRGGDSTIMMVFTSKLILSVQKDGITTLRKVADSRGLCNDPSWRDWHHQSLSDKDSRTPVYPAGKISLPSYEPLWPLFYPELLTRRSGRLDFWLTQNKSFTSSPASLHWSSYVVFSPCSITSSFESEPTNVKDEPPCPWLESPQQ